MLQLVSEAALTTLQRDARSESKDSSRVQV